MPSERSRNAALAVFLVGLGSAWNGGNAGAVARPLAEEFDVSLTAVGLLSGTVFFAAIVAANLLAAAVANRTGVAGALRGVCLLSAAGNVICAVSPSFVPFAAGRVLAGLGLGLALVLAPVFARDAGGVKLVGVFGASIQLGIAGGLVVGSVLLDAGVDWRVGFAVSALVGISALPFFPGRIDAAVRARPRHLLRAELRDPDVWRLALLFTAILGAPLVVGAWLVPYLGDSGMAAGLAGALSFLLFASSAALRFAGGSLAKRGLSPSALGGGAPLLAAAGVALLAADQSTGAVLAAMLLIGAGVALPYAEAMVEGQWLFPPEPVAPLALLLLITNTVPIFAIPAVGSALEAGNGEAAMLVIAVFLALAGLLNLRPPKRQIQVPGSP